LPDCKMTMAISARHTSRSMIIRTVFKSINPLNCEKYEL
jgi:hypothetical protein